jgi:group I intron endonuclease
MCGIYKITNNINGKVYIGQSICIERRWYQHKWDTDREDRLGYNSIIHKAFRKYGIENFSFEIIEECGQELLDEKERYWIEKLNTIQPNGYNILLGGQEVRGKIWRCVDCGKIVYKESKRCVECNNKHRVLISQSNRPEPLELAKMIKENGFEETGRQFSVSGNAIKKWCISYDIPSKKKELVEWYNSQIGVKESIKKPVKRAVRQIDLKTGEVINSFNSLADAMRFLGKKKSSHIIECCQGKLKQAYGFKWEYI